MRVLLVTAEYPPALSGGIGVFYRELARELTAQGAAVCVLAADPAVREETRDDEAGVEVRRVPIPAGRFLRLPGTRFDASPLRRSRLLSAAASRSAQAFRPDIVETHDWAAPLWRPPSRPFVVRLHGASSVLASCGGRRPGRLLRLLERRMLLRADRLVAVSEWVRTRSVEVFSIPADPIRIVPNGVDIERFQPAPSGVGARHTVPSAHPRDIVFAGTLREDKGVVELLEALEIVFRERPNATATLAGGPESWHELPPAIRRHVERLQVTAPKRLRLLGGVNHERLADLYRRAGVCVFPSHVEAFGLACVEAMSCGAPVIASRLGAAAEIVEDGRSGLLIDPREPRQIADGILRLLSSPGLAQTLGRQARRRVEERYSVGRTAERTLELYRELQGGKQPWQSQDAA